MTLSLQAKPEQEICELVKAKSILYLSGAQVLELGVFDFPKLCSCIEDVYRLHWHKQVRMPKTEYLTYAGRSSYDRIIVLLGALGGSRPLTGAKLICSSIGNLELGFPRASGLIVLNDVVTQRAFCIMEGAQISAARTAAVTGVALARLMPPGVAKVALIGCGFLAKTHILMWSQLFANRNAVLHLYDVNEHRSEELAEYARTRSLNVKIGHTAESVIQDADIIIPATTATSPYIQAEWIKADSLYSAVSLLDPSLDVFRQADHIVVDDLETCKNEGRPLHHLDHTGEILKMSIFSMGELIVNDQALRTTQQKRILFNPMGTVITDLAVAGLIFERACCRGSGTALPA
jgi:ornithine cyclodeaminase/alanine dehydrogenase-like protein (mu-crystallin family)